MPELLLGTAHPCAREELGCAASAVQDPPSRGCQPDLWAYICSVMAIAQISLGVVCVIIDGQYLGTHRRDEYVCPASAEALCDGGARAVRRGGRPRISNATEDLVKSQSDGGSLTGPPPEAVSQ